jgi:hypothetical protein
LGILLFINKDNKKYLEDKSLSWKAKGLISFFSRTSKLKNFTIDSLVNISKDNRISLTSGIKELIAKKYLYRFRYTIKKKGRVFNYIYICFGSSNVFNDKQFKEIKRVLSSGFVNAEKLHSNIILEYIHDNTLSSISLDILLAKNINARLSYQNDELKILQNLWTTEIREHDKSSNAWQIGCDRLEKRFNRLSRKNLNILVRGKKSETFEIISSAIKIYGELLRSSDTVLKNKSPWYVGFGEFFAFSNYTKEFVVDRGTSIVRKLVGVSSWFDECSKGLSYCMDKYSYKIKSPYPKLVEKLRRELRLDIVSAREENILIRGSIYYQEFFDKNKSKLNLSNKADERYAIRTIKYFRDFVDEKHWQLMKQ